MKRIPFIVGLIAMLAMLACAPKDEKAVSEAPAPAAKEAAAPAPASPAPDGVLPMSYMDAATALAADDFDKARVSLTALAKQSTGEMQTRAQAAANASDIAAMRESFKELSAIASEMQLPPDYAVAYCPMYKGGSKWVQKKETLANPYYGETMLTCGNFIN
jgi:Cu(I)/Ag(I) efflux system membrane fusion protein